MIFFLFFNEEKVDCFTSPSKKKKKKERSSYHFYLDFAKAKKWTNRAAE